MEWFYEGRCETSRGGGGVYDGLLAVGVGAGGGGGTGGPSAACRETDRAVHSPPPPRPHRHRGLRSQGVARQELNCGRGAPLPIHTTTARTGRTALLTIIYIHAPTAGYCCAARWEGTPRAGGGVCVLVCVCPAARSGAAASVGQRRVLNVVDWGGGRKGGGRGRGSGRRAGV